MCSKNTVSVEVRPPQALNNLINQSLSHPEVKRARTNRSRGRQVDRRKTAPSISRRFPAIASGGTFDPFDPRQNQQTGGWWMAEPWSRCRCSPGFLIENQVARGQCAAAASATATGIEQA
ncbi:MAG: hypothetical protein U0231_16695 [Nitrospiraceae bacterium]